MSANRSDVSVTVGPAVPEPSSPSQWQFLDALGDGVYGVDRNGRCTFVNRAALGVLGYNEPGELLGRNMHELIHHTRPDGSHYPIGECPLLSSLSTGRAVRLENELLWRRDGTSFFAEYSSFPIQADEDAPDGSVVTFTDLSVRKDSRRRHALQHAVSQVLESPEATDAVQTRLVAVVGAGFGWDAGALWLPQDGSSGLHRASVWQQASAVSQAPDQAAEAVMMGQELAGRAWAEKQLAVTTSCGQGGGIAFPVRTGGRVTGVFQFQARQHIELDPDLSDELATLGRQVGQFLARRETEAALRDSEALKAAIMETALDCVVVVDADTHIRELNPAAEATFSWSRDAALGVELGALILPADFLVDHLKKFAAFLHDGEVSAINKRVEAEAVRSGGEHFPVEISVTPLKAGGEALFATTMRDITERREAERQIADARDSAETANKAKSTFIADMSHELRTPLSAIIGYSEMLQEEVGDGGDPAEFVTDMGKIESNARHLLGLINDVLDLSKIESGRMEVFAEAFDPATMVNDVAATVTPLVEKKGNTLEVSMAPAIGGMRSDLVKIKQMLLNLLSNASKFTERGTILLSASRQSGPGGDWLVFAVKDSGLGMTQEQMAKLFQRYAQAEASTSSEFGGTGLGLSISRAFAEMLGGRIEVTSEYGRGSTFTITLPAQLPS